MKNSILSGLAVVLLVGALLVGCVQTPPATTGTPTVTSTPAPTLAGNEQPPAPPNDSVAGSATSSGDVPPLPPA